MINFKTTALALLLASGGLTAYTQKLPSVQTGSLAAPVNIKIDGKATEWGGNFRAYNNHVQCFYTLSNDDHNIYLVVQAVDKDIVRRILNGGITVAVSKSGKKVDKGLPGITFPLFDNDNRFIWNTESSRANLTPAQKDSITRLNNTNFDAKAKNIGIKDISAIKDSLISVYNDNGIKVAGKFDNKFAFTYEIAIPLKYFSLKTGDGKFLYHFTINQVEQKGVNIKYSDTDPTKIVSVNITKGAQMGQEATDFWGEYTLARK